MEGGRDTGPRAPGVLLGFRCYSIIKHLQMKPGPGEASRMSDTWLRCRSAAPALAAELAPLPTPPPPPPPLPKHALRCTPCRRQIEQRSGSAALAARLLPQQAEEVQNVGRAKLLWDVLTTRAGQAVPMPQLAAGLFGLPGEACGGVMVVDGHGLLAAWLRGAARCSVQKFTTVALALGPADPGVSASLPTSPLLSTCPPNHLPAGPFELQQYLQKLQAVAAEAAPRLQAVLEKPGAQELLADVQWGLLQRFTARGIKFAAGLQEGGSSSSANSLPASSSGSSDRIPGDGSALYQAQTQS